MLNALLQQEIGLLLALFFIAAGLAIWWLATYAWRSRQYPGDVSIQLETVTPRVGSTLHGRLVFSGTAPAGPCQLCVVCEHVTRHADAAHQRTIWTDAVTLNPRGGEVGFVFSLPAHLPVSPPVSRPAGHTEDRWRLLLQVPAMSKPLAFDLQVSAAMPTASQMTAESARLSVAAAHTPQSIVSDAATIADEPERLHIILDGRRSRHDTLPTLLFALMIAVLGGLVLATISQAFGLLILLLAGLIVLVALRTFYDEQSLTLQGERIDLQRRTLFRSWQRSLAVQDIDRLIALPEQTSQISTRQDFQSFTLYALTGGSTQHVLFSHVIGTQLTQTLMQHLLPRLAPAARTSHLQAGASNGLSLVHGPAGITPWWQKHLLTLGFLATALTAVGTVAELWISEPAEPTRPRIAATAESWFAALEANRLGDMQAIVKLGFPIDIQASTGSSALALASARGNLSIAQWLLESGADLHQRNGKPDSDDYLSTALMHAARGANPELVALLLAHGARIDETDAVQRTPLHFMARSGCIECIVQLLRHGAALEARANGSRGETPLMLAAAGGHLQAVQILLAYGARPDTRDKHGHDALDWAEQHRQPAVIEYLKPRLGNKGEHRQSAS